MQAIFVLIVVAAAGSTPSVEKSYLTPGGCERAAARVTSTGGQHDAYCAPLQVSLTRPDAEPRP